MITSRRLVNCGTWCLMLLIPGALALADKLPDEVFPDRYAPLPVVDGNMPLEIAQIQPDLEELPQEDTPPRMPEAPAQQAEPEADSDVFVIREPVDPTQMDEPDAAEQDLVTVQFVDVPLEEVVRMFTRISGANIIASGTNLQGVVTASLNDVHWQTALISILDQHDLTLTERTPGSQVYSIVHKQPDAPEPMLIEPIFLKFARVDDAQTIVRGLLVGGGSVSAYRSGNALIVRSSALNIADIRRVIESIDRPREQVYIEAKFLELNDDAIRTLGINWQVLEGYRVGVSELAWGQSSVREWDRQRENISLRGDERRQTDGMAQYYDRDGAQFQSETATDRESPPGSDRFVTDRTIEPTRTIEDRVERRRDIRSESADTFSRQIEDVRTAVLSAQDLSIVLSALRQMDGVSVVSNPKIIVANEEEATIHIGEKERPFISSVTPGQQGIAPIITYNPGEEVDFGVKLSVVPTINTDSNITVKIEPELTRFVRDAVAPNGQSYPVIATKTIRTVFSLEDGKTAAIGGLTETTEREATTKIPLLGDIPLLGKFFFSHERREKAQRETIIFVTVGLANPHRIETQEGLPEDTDLYHRYLFSQQARQQALIDGPVEEEPTERRRFLGFPRRNR